MLVYIRNFMVVTNLDRLGRNSQNITSFYEHALRKKYHVGSYKFTIDGCIEGENFRRLINNLVIELYKYQVESERKRICER